MKAKTVKTRKKRNPLLTCEYCGHRTARRTKLNHTFGKLPDLIVMTNVDTIVCDNCGQSYLEGDSLEAVAQVLARPQRHTKTLPIAVAVL